VFCFVEVAGTSRNVPMFHNPAILVQAEDVDPGIVMVLVAVVTVVTVIEVTFSMGIGQPLPPGNPDASRVWVAALWGDSPLQRYEPVAYRSILVAPIWWPYTSFIVLWLAHAA
jgi:hypothetical protein